MPRTAQPIRLAELADHLKLTVEGDSTLEIGGFASLVSAGPDELAFVRDAGHLEALSRSAAPALIAPAELDVGPRSVLRSPRPGHDFSRLMQYFAPVVRPPAGIGAGALVDPDALVDPSAAIEPGAVVAAGARVGPRSVVGARSVLESGVELGADCWIHSGVVIREGSRLGDRVVLQPGVVIGGDGFGYTADAAGRPQPMAQRGRVVIEDDVEIGANSTVDRATLDETRIRRGAKIDNLVQIAHNCDIGEDALIVAQTGLAGGTVIGRGAIVMARVGATGHLRVGEGAFVGAGTGLHRDVAPGARVYGAPQMDERLWHRVVAGLKRLPELYRRVRRIERALSIRAGGRPPSGGDSEPD